MTAKILLVDDDNRILAGYLDLQSNVGVGTTVTVRFPADRIVRSPRDAKAVGAADRKAG